MKNLIRVFNAILVFLLACRIAPSTFNWHFNAVIYFVILEIAYILINIFPSMYGGKLQTARLRNSNSGCELLIIFLISSLLSTVYLTYLAFNLFPNEPLKWVISFVVALVIELIVFWNGITRVYLTSKQLHLKWRVIGLLFGWVPLANLIVLLRIIKIVLKETVFENEKIVVNTKRESEQICRTKYPILLVHGVFFRDFKHFNYWGRVPEELKKNGATIYYGNQQSAASVVDSGKELAERIRQVLAESGAEKVNIIAHSKGGLDCRYAISQFGAEANVASLTTINTPHRGCLFADYLLSKLPERTRDAVANKYNAALKKLGDENPDFIAAIKDLTAAACKKTNELVKDRPNVLYQSFGSKLNKASYGRLPLNLSYHLVKRFDGPNDGLVSTDSFGWGETNKLLTVKGKRGISHGDIIDLYRENIDAFDVREFYVGLVNDLRLREL